MFLAAVVAVLLVVTGPARASYPQAPVQAIQEAGVTAQLDAKLPLDATLVDESGGDVKLGELFDGKKPVILTLVYYTCPNLCTTELTNLVSSLKDPQMGLRLGDHYRIVTISFSAKDTPALARAKKRNYLEALGQGAQENSWHFLTGKPDQVKRVANAVGFGYKLNPATGEYMHGSAIFLCTPDGQVSRTIQDIIYPVPELRDSLIFASEGKIGSPIFRMAWTCGLISFHGGSGTYTWAAVGLLRVAAILMLLFLGTMIGIFRLLEWLRERRRQRAALLHGPDNQVTPV